MTTIWVGGFEMTTHFLGGLRGSGDGNFSTARMNLQGSMSAAGAGAASGAPTKRTENGEAQR